MYGGDREARREFADAVRACHRATVEPYWNQERSELVDASARFTRLMLDGGVDLLPRSLCPSLLRRRPPVLEVSCPRPVEVLLQGRGLVITSTVFSSIAVSLIWDPLDTTQPPRPTVPGPPPPGPL
ncbi:hypothetical protein [Streptomyces griseus]|uniref:hypothetical protein n=1 Tax=Streptomyces griseus TaxID=1911 RepID=UPI000A36B31F|nr:hypothetical protein [Streptomyces fimicarius]